MNNFGLNTRDPVALLLSDACRRPDIKALVDRIDEMTSQDIDECVVPLKWYREALHLLQARNRQLAALPQAEAYADAMGAVEIIPERLGEVWRSLEDRTIDNRGLSLDVKIGDLLFDDGDMLWVGSFPILKRVAIKAENLGRMPRNEFAKMVLAQNRI